MSYHIKTTQAQDARLRAAVGTPAHPATDAEVTEKIVKLLYQFLVREEAKNSIKAAKAAWAQSIIAADIMHQQELGLTHAAEIALQAAIDARDNADSAVPGPDWNQ